VAAHAGAHTCAGEFPANGVSGAAFEAVHQRRDRQCGRISHEQVHVVGLAVELDQLDIELGAHGAHGGFGEGEYWIGEQFASELGYEDEVGV